ncbi:hypothetical protein L596_017814 [Steinernema carpocapsae]|uniref:Uncharacterized protein n=1 Tax=Steinernema carpocapsae TaxID=34508 RepID=A0A4U5N326_STECR|nr:hypothetical protein L596_017814 [Steinernema carpocapsae]
MRRRITVGFSVAINGSILLDATISEHRIGVSFEPGFEPFWSRILTQLTPDFPHSRTVHPLRAARKKARGISSRTTSIPASKASLSRSLGTARANAFCTSLGSVLKPRFSDPTSVGSNFEDFFDRSFHHESPDGIHFEGSTVDSFCCVPPPRIHARYVREARFQFSAASTRKRHKGSPKSGDPLHPDTLRGSLFRFRDHVSQNSTPKANPNPDFSFLGTTSCSVVFCCFYFRLHFENDGGGESRTLTEILSFRRISSHTTSKSPANPSPSTVSAKTGRALESELGPFTE